MRSDPDLIVAATTRCPSSRISPICVAASVSTVSAPDGHGMILTGRCVDIEDTTYRVIVAGAGP
jgi:hypothetical protein